MCGIGSITISEKATTVWDLQAGAEALLKELDSRGKDACGIMALDSASQLHVQKAAVRAYDFCKGMEPIPADTVAVAVHTRFATKGAKEWQKNNHPVSDGDAYIMHNGVVDDSLLERSPGAPEVDTYAISAALSGAGVRGEDETPRQYAKRVAQALAGVDGSIACIAAIDGEAVMLSMKLNGSPLWFAEADGVRIAASTRKAVEQAADAMELELPGETRQITTTIKGKTSTRTETYEKIDEAKEGRVLSWQAGRHNMLMIQVPERIMQRNWRKGGAYQGSYQGGSGYGSGGYQSSAGYWRDGKFVKWGSEEHKYWVEFDKAERERLAAAKPAASTTPPQYSSEPREYPAGTPAHGSAEGLQLAKLFAFWRLTSKGREWARLHPLNAKSYDEALSRAERHGNKPPFPTPKELHAMQQDPLTFLAEQAPDPTPPHEASDDRCFVGDSCGVVSVHQSSDDEVYVDRTMQEIVDNFLMGFGQDEDEPLFTEWKTCELCLQTCDDVQSFDDGDLCGDCARIWAWSDPPKDERGRRLDA